MSTSTEITEIGKNELLLAAKNELVSLQSLVVRLTDALQEQQPKADFYDTVTQAEDQKDFAEVAKILNMGLGRNKIMALLRDMQVLRTNNEPYQQYVDRGYFKVVEVDKTDSFGKTRIFTKPVVTQKGIDWIRQQLMELDI